MLPTAPPRPLHILVVDDHEDSARALAYLLRSEGHVVETAHSFAAALAVAGVGEPLDALVCDILLPDGDGCELLRPLVAVAGDRGLPAIAVTGVGEKWLEECRRSGYRRMLTKPVRFEDVRSADVCQRCRVG